MAEANKTDSVSVPENVIDQSAIVSQDEDATFDLRDYLGLDEGEKKGAKTQPTFLLRGELEKTYAVPKS